MEIKNSCLEMKLFYEVPFYLSAPVTCTEVKTDLNQLQSKRQRFEYNKFAYLICNTFKSDPHLVE